MSKKDCLALSVQKTCVDMMRNSKNLWLVPMLVGLLVVGLVSVGQAALLTKEDFNLYGYVEASYLHNFNNPNSQFNNGRIFDVDANSFRPHMAQFVFEKEGKAAGAAMADRAGFRAKLNFGEDAKLTGGSGNDDVDFQEAYVQYIAPIGNGLDIRIGRMNTLIGFEVIESPLNPNFSRSFLFGLGEPFTTTGLRASYEVNEMVNVSLGVINSWFGSTADFNRSKSIEALIGLTPIDWLGISIFGFWGPEGAVGAKNTDLVQVGGIVTVQATDQTSLVVEGYWAQQENATTNNRDAQWKGLAGYVIHDFDDQWGVRLRGEVFKDADGFLTGTSQRLWEGTITGQYKPVPSLITRLEFRFDRSDEKTFQLGNRAVDHQETIATEVIFLF